MLDDQQEPNPSTSQVNGINLEHFNNMRYGNRSSKAVQQGLDPLAQDGDSEPPHASWFQTLHEEHFGRQQSHGGDGDDPMHSPEQSQSPLPSLEERRLAYLEKMLSTQFGQLGNDLTTAVKNGLESISVALGQRVSTASATLASTSHDSNTSRTPNQTSQTVHETNHPAQPATRRTNHKATPKLADFPARRPQEVRGRQKLIRQHLNRLCGDREVEAYSVSLAEAKEYAMQRKANPNHPECCSAEAIRICIAGGPRSIWNQSAGRVFARSYISFHNLNSATPSLREDIFEATMTRFRGLKAQVKRDQLDAEIREARIQRDRRKGRKSALFHRRLEVCELYPHLAQYTNFIRSLGPDGMSSDESDYDELTANPPARLRAPRYYILRPKWRNPALTNWLHVFDSIYSILRRTTMSRRGSYAHSRGQSRQQVRYSDSSHFVCGLSTSAYNEVWLEGRADVDFVVEPSPETTNFVHDASVYQFIESSISDI